MLCFKLIRFFLLLTSWLNASAKNVNNSSICATGAHLKINMRIYKINSNNAPSVFQGRSLRTLASGTALTCRSLGRSGSVTSPVTPSGSAGTWRPEAKSGSHTTSSTSTKGRTETPTSSNSRSVKRNLLERNEMSPVHKMCLCVCLNCKVVQLLLGLLWV